MKFHLITTVWGDWHLNAMEKVMLPTILAQKNLPALKELGDVYYKFITVRKDVSRIEKMPLFQKIRELVRAEIVVASEEDNPPDYHHLQWWHNSIAAAKNDGAVIAFMPPDVVWSDCSVGNMGKIMASGKKSVAMPYIRVLAESCIAEIFREYGNKNGGVVTLSPSEVVKKGFQHLHPLTACLYPKSPHSHPTMELYWNVPNEGAVLRTVNREAFAFDASRVNASGLVYAADLTDVADMHFVTDSEDMIMLSLVPMTKDMGNIGIYLPNYSIKPMDVSRNCIHPENYTPLNNIYARQKIRLHYKKPTESLWRKAEARSEAEFRQVVVMNNTTQIWKAIRDAGCTTAAKILAVALQATAFAKRWREEKPLIIFAPDETAFEKFSKEKIHDLVRKGYEHRLLQFIYEHVGICEKEDAESKHIRSISRKKYILKKKGENWMLNDSIPVSKTCAMGKYEIYITDRVLV